MPQVIVIMGVSGAGKTTLGRAVAQASGLPFLDADDLHPPASRAKMSAGVPLDDADRAPWLDSVAAVMSGWVTSGQGGVVACSALKRAYRDRLRVAAPDLRLVFLDLEAAALAVRLAERRGHYFNPLLLESQLAVLEPPDTDEPAIRIDGALPTDRAVRLILETA